MGNGPTVLLQRYLASLKSDGTIYFASSTIDEYEVVIKGKKSKLRPWLVKNTMLKVVELDIPKPLIDASRQHLRRMTVEIAKDYREMGKRDKVVQSLAIDELVRVEKK